MLVKELKKSVVIICPTCKRKSNLELSQTVINESKQLTTISIPSGLVCDHHFQAYIDKQFKVRSYQKVDYDYSSESNEELSAKGKEINKNEKEIEKIKKLLIEKILKDQNNVGLWYNLGLIYIKKKEFENAIKAFKKIVKLDSNYIDAWINLGILYWQNLSYNYKDNSDLSINCLYKAVSLDTNLYKVWNRLGLYLGNLNRYEESINAFKKAIEIEPTYQYSWYNLALVYLDQAKIKKVTKVLNEAAEKKVNFDDNIWQQIWRIKNIIKK